MHPIPSIANESKNSNAFYRMVNNSNKYLQCT